MPEKPEEASPSDQLMYKVIGLAVGAIGHGAYLGLRYLQHGRVNSVSFGLFIFLAGLTLLLAVVVIVMKRAEARSQQDRWFIDRG